MNIGFDYDELHDSNNTGKMTLLFSTFMVIVTIIVIATSESLPSDEIEQQLIVKKAEYIREYIDNRNMIPAWQKDMD
jgi:hypothetical protein